MARRRTWDEVRRERMSDPAAQAGYEAARRAFELGERVRALREAQGMSQAELARRMGTSQPAVARLEAGGVEPSIETLDRVSRALGSRLTIRLEDPVPA